LVIKEKIYERQQKKKNIWKSIALVETSRVDLNVIVTTVHTNNIINSSFKIIYLNLSYDRMFL